MPEWIHNRADHIRRDNPGMKKSTSFAIATQQAHATGHTPQGYGTAEGKREAKQKYDKPPSEYKQTSDPKHKTAEATSSSTTRRSQMSTKLAGRLPLHEMIAQHLEGARTKIAAAEEKDEKEKKLLKFEKKEHGHTPSVEEEKGEKKASADIIDIHDPEEVEKLASALEALGDQLLEKEADSVENGGEKKQGGEQLATQSPTPGKQPYKHDKSKSHDVPVSTPLTTAKDNPGAKNVVETDENKTPGGKGAKMPPNILRKTAGQSVRERIEAKKQEAEEVETETEEADGSKAEEAAEATEPVDPAKEKAKKASAADYILGKLAEVTGGGEKVPDDEKKAPGYGSVAVPSNPGRQLISSNKAPVSATKREAKSPRKAELAQVLTEPAMSRAHDSKVHENLRNASKGGVKIAAATVLLRKIAEEGCSCDGKGTCRHCKLKSAVEAKKAS